LHRVAGRRPVSAEPRFIPRATQATRTDRVRLLEVGASATTAALACWLQGSGNHGLWLAFLCFMLLRGLQLAIFGWRLLRADA